MVIVGYDNDHLYFHDPNGQSYIAFPYDQFRAACSPEVTIPSTGLYSFISVQGRLWQPDEPTITLRVLTRAVETLSGGTIRQGKGWRGVEAIQQYARDLSECLGARDMADRRVLYSKMAYYFYPKGNQTRADAAFYVRRAAALFPQAARELNEFSDAFLQAARVYMWSAATAVHAIVNWSESAVAASLPDLQQDAREIYRWEKAALEALAAAVERLG